MSELAKDLLVISLLTLAFWVALRMFRMWRWDRRIARENRLKECEEVVRSFAQDHGYIARSAISKDELEKLIASGISGQKLALTIIDRIKRTKGLGLGYQDSDYGKIPVILPEGFRDKHIYVVGKSGYGKTNLLRHLIFQDLAAGNGLGILAPEYEMLVDELLPFIPEHRIQDVIYFNPADTERPVVLNPLHLTDGDDIDLHVDEVFTILQRVVGEGGPRMDEILRHSLYVLIERPHSTLMDFGPLLDRHDSSFRDEIIHTTADEQARHFFQHTYPQMPKDAHFPITNRLGRIIRAKYARNCLCPPKTTSLSQKEVAGRLLNIRQAMDEGRILIFNLSDGMLGEAASQLIGQFIVSQFQTATMSRADMSKDLRKPFYLYLDEFQNFCGTASRSYEKILSRARKYKLGMVLAHQQTGQIPQDLLREIFGNVSTMIAFQVSQHDAAMLSKELISQDQPTARQVPVQDLLQQKVGEAYCRIANSAFPFRTHKVSSKPYRAVAERVIAESRARYGIPVTAAPEPLALDQESPADDPLSDLDPGEVFE